MEGLAWLLMKMAVLLAITGASFLSLGWWLRGRQVQPEKAEQPAESSVHVSRPELTAKIESLRAELRSVENQRDALMRELEQARLHISTLESAPPAAPVMAVADGEPVPQTEPAKASKPKAVRKPRSKKAKS